MKTSPPIKDLYTLQDLKSWSLNGTFLAVVGYPIRHSLSPEMHNAAIKALTQNHPWLSDWYYLKFEIHPDDLEEAISLFHKNKFIGLNLTVPHKILATKWVKPDEREVELTGACNTLKWMKDGYLGYNTDLYGLRTACETELSTDFANSEIIILGAGGAARAAAVACLEAKAKILHLANRTLSKVEAIKDELSSIFPETSINTHSLPGSISTQSTKPLIINATSLGLKIDDPSPFDISNLSKDTKVFDMIYNPPETQLLSEAKTNGLTTSNGLSMLVYQGERSLKIWTELTPSAQVMKEAIIKGLNQ